MQGGGGGGDVAGCTYGSDNASLCALHLSILFDSASECLEQYCACGAAKTSRSAITPGSSLNPNNCSVKWGFQASLQCDQIRLVSCKLGNGVASLFQSTIGLKSAAAALACIAILLARRHLPQHCGYLG